MNPFGGITEDVATEFATYTFDTYIGVRTIISPLPSTTGVDFTWRSKVERAGIQLFDIEWAVKRAKSILTMSEHQAVGTVKIPTVIPSKA